MALPAGLHAPFRHRRALQVQLRAKRVFGWAKARTQDREIIRGLEQAYLDVVRGVERVLADESDAEPTIDAHLLAVAAEISDRWSGDQSVGEHIAGVVERLKEEAREIDCSLSCTRENPVCCGRDADNLIVDSYGLCISEFKGPFEVALASARSCYSEVEFFSGPVHLGTMFDGGSNSFAPGYDVFVSGLTRGDENERVVCVLFRTMFVEDSCLDAVWYVLFHELYVHALADPLERVKHRESDVFSEGWMDWIALHSLLRSTEDSSFASATGYADAELESLRVAAMNYHAAREKSGGREDGAHVASNIRQGRAAAAALLGEFEDLLGDESEAWRHLISLSIRLNVGVDPALRNRFALNVALGFDPKSPSKRCAQWVREGLTELLAGAQTPEGLARTARSVP